MLSAPGTAEVKMMWPKEIIYKAQKPFTVFTVLALHNLL